MKNNLDPKEIIISNNKVSQDMFESCVDDILFAANILIKKVKNGNKVLWCGNGGSAADSQHMSTELMGGLRDHDRPPIPSISLTTDSSFLTAWSNDTDFRSVFSRQIEAIGNSGDVLIAISTSGNSTNIMKALIMSKKMGATTIALLGNNGGKIKKHSDIPIIVKSPSTPFIQEIHRIIYHRICEVVEKEVTNSSKNSQ